MRYAVTYAQGTSTYDERHYTSRVDEERLVTKIRNLQRAGRRIVRVERVD